MINAPVRKSELIQVEGTKKCSVRSKIILIEIVKNEMSMKKITESMTSNKIE